MCCARVCLAPRCCFVVVVVPCCVYAVCMWMSVFGVLLRVAGVCLLVMSARCLSCVVFSCVVCLCVCLMCDVCVVISCAFSLYYSIHHFDTHDFLQQYFWRVDVPNYACAIDNILQSVFYNNLFVCVTTHTRLCVRLIHILQFHPQTLCAHWRELKSDISSQQPRACDTNARVFISLAV